MHLTTPPAPRLGLRDREVTALALVTALFLAMGVALAVMTPVFQNPDETSHLDMVEHYAHHPTEMAGPSLRQTVGVRRSLEASGLTDIAGDRSVAGIPAARPRYRSYAENGGARAATSCPVTCQSYQFIHPPLWYLVAAPVARVMAPMSVPSVLFAIRLLNVLLCALAIPATWYLARQVRPGAPLFALLAAMGVACFTPFVATAAAVNNDGGVLALMAVAIALAARVLRGSASVRCFATLGVVVGLGLLVKGEFLVVAGVTLAIVVVGAPRERRLASIAAYVVPVSLAGLWWVRVVLDTHSFTPAGLALVRRAAPGGWMHATPFTVLGDRLPGFVDDFFGRYGWKLTALPSWALGASQAAVVVLLVAWLATRRVHGQTVIGRVGALLLAAYPVLLFLAAFATAYHSFHTEGQVSGLSPRYVYGAVPVLALGLAVALTSVGERIERVGARRVQLGALVVLALWGAGSFAVATRGEYETYSLSRLFQRAGVVSPIAHPKLLFAMLALLWLSSLAGALAVAARLSPPGGGRRPDRG